MADVGDLFAGNGIQIVVVKDVSFIGKPKTPSTKAMSERRK